MDLRKSLNEMRYHGSQHECELALTAIHAISSLERAKHFPLFPSLTRRFPRACNFNNQEFRKQLWA